MYYEFFDIEKYGENTINYFKEKYNDVLVTDKGIFVNCEETGYFHVASVSREDFEYRGFDTSNLTNEDMRSIGNRMCEMYCSNDEFWSEIDFLAKEYGLDKIKDYDD